MIVFSFSELLLHFHSHCCSDWSFCVLQGGFCREPYTKFDFCDRSWNKQRNNGCNSQVSYQQSIESHMLLSSCGQLFDVSSFISLPSITNFKLWNGFFLAGKLQELPEIYAEKFVVASCCWAFIWIVRTLQAQPCFPCWFRVLSCKSISLSHSLSLLLSLRSKYHPDNTNCFRNLYKLFCSLIFVVPSEGSACIFPRICRQNRLQVPRTNCSVNSSSSCSTLSTRLYKLEGWKGQRLHSNIRLLPVA